MKMTSILSTALLLQWVPGGSLCQRKQRVVRVVCGSRIGTSPCRKSGLFHAPSMQKSRESVVAFNAQWFGINPVLLVALLAELLLDGPRPGPHRRILDRGLVGECCRPVRVQRSMRCRFSRDPKASVFGLKFVRSTTRVFPSQWPRESPNH